MFIFFVSCSILSVSAVLAQGCQNGATIDRNGFWYSCVNGAEVAQGCIIDRTGQRVAFGTENEVPSNSPLYGFYMTCSNSGSYTHSVTACWTYDLAQNRNVRVNIGGSIIVEPQQPGLKMQFSCIQTPNGGASYSAKPING